MKETSRLKKRLLIQIERKYNFYKVEKLFLLFRNAVLTFICYNCLAILSGDMNNIFILLFLLLVPLTTFFKEIYTLHYFLEEYRDFVMLHWKNDQIAALQDFQKNLVNLKWDSENSMLDLFKSSLLKFFIR